jgi:hypothetical protein
MTRLLACLLLFASQSLAAPIATFSDPAGDDVGAGSLVYPLNPDFQEGDLDLLSFRLEREADGFWLEAAFANTIRNPATAFIGAAADSLADLARKGFYTFNIDVYIDTDRLRDSGNTFSLPGRRVRIDAANAWEKTVVLSPRPELMRAELLDALQRQYPDRGATELAASIDQAIFWPDKIRVRGKNVAFFVPQTFFASSDGSDWAMTVLVTGAKPYTSAGGGLLPSGKTPLDELDLGVLQPAAGRPMATFGHTSRSAQLPVVDVLLPSREQQLTLLSGQLPLTGVSWGPHASRDTFVSPALAIPRQAIPGTADAADDSLLSRSVGFFKRLMGNSPAATTVPAAAAVPTASVKNLLDPGVASAPDKATAIQARTPTAVPERLRALKKMREEGLLDEAEYKLQKQRILNEL